MSLPDKVEKLANDEGTLGFESVRLNFVKFYTYKYVYIYIYACINVDLQV